MSHHSERAVTVVIPAYDQAEFIDDCLDSIAAQTWAGPIDVVVIDDESPDDIADRARAHRLAPRVIRQPNTGVAGARNRGIRAASHPWIAFLDADDRWAPHKLAAQMDALLDLNRPALSFCRYRRHTADGDVVDIAAEHPAQDLQPTPRKLMRQNFIGTSTVVTHRCCLQRCGGFPESPQLRDGGQDYALWLRIAAYFPLVYAPTVGMHYTVHHNNRVGTDPAHHHRGGLEALRDFRQWDPHRFRSLASNSLAPLITYRTGKFLADAWLTHRRQFPSGAVGRALRTTLSMTI